MKNQKVALKKVFKAPTVQEVQKYCNERQNGISAYGFVNFYQAKDWMIGKNKMKDWQASVRTWEQKNRENGINQTTNNGAFKGGNKTDKINGRSNPFTIDDFTESSGSS